MLFQRLGSDVALRARSGRIFPWLGWGLVSFLRTRLPFHFWLSLLRLGGGKNRKVPLAADSRASHTGFQATFGPKEIKEYPKL